MPIFDELSTSLNYSPIIAIGVLLMFFATCINETWSAFAGKPTSVPIKASLKLTIVIFFISGATIASYNTFKIIEMDKPINPSLYSVLNSSYNKIHIKHQQAFKDKFSFFMDDEVLTYAELQVLNRFIDDSIAMFGDEKQSPKTNKAIENMTK